MGRHKSRKRLYTVGDCPIISSCIILLMVTLMVPSVGSLSQFPVLRDRGGQSISPNRPSSLGHQALASTPIPPYETSLNVHSLVVPILSDPSPSSAPSSFHSSTSATTSTLPSPPYESYPDHPSHPPHVDQLGPPSSLATPPSTAPSVASSSSTASINHAVITTSSPSTSTSSSSSPTLLSLSAAQLLPQPSFTVEVLPLSMPLTSGHHNDTLSSNNFVTHYDHLSETFYDNGNNLTQLRRSKREECDRVFVSNAMGPKNGTFTSPFIENGEHHSRQCIYTFVAAENERVQVTFHSFSLRGEHPECNHEYMDLYTELEDVNQDLIVSPFGGRYCGRIIPRRRVSLHQVMVVGFYTDETAVNDEVFSGSYEFIDATPYVAGTPMPHQVCSYTIYMDQKREGQFRSPTYPGVYPKNMQCQYRFLGRKGQRVRLEFMDFDLFYGGSHCPFDYIKVFDGASADDPQIGTYCGQQRNLVIYSSGENLFVQFKTLQRTADTQNRGFNGWFEFSERFVNLGFIGKNDGEHIRGTECDQKILSRKESNGTVYSPNYPFLYHTNIVCKYFIYGLQDAQHLETVRLEFEKFEIPTNDPNECNDAYVRIYLSGDNLDEPDHIFCGADPPTPLVSETPILIMVFSSGNSQGQGFKGRYWFETDYKVQGTPDPPGCRFKYLSESTKAADFNSPRHPSNYPSSLDCIYDFLGQPGEQVKIVFNYFRIRADKATIGYNEVCSEDWIEVYEIYPSGREYKFGRFCASTAPGPIISDVGVSQMKVILRTDDTAVASGFSASYAFLPALTSLGDCGQNVTGQQSGVITSPGYPSQYPPYRQICNWFITVRPKHKVLLFFEYFLIEGDPASRGCPGAVVRVWKELNAPPIELCGEGLSNDTLEFVSSSEMLRISFITADKAVGSGGFKAIWTEVKDPALSSGKCDQFKCSTNQYCISPTLTCNGEHNCGKYDDSDEAKCIKVREMNTVFLSGVMAVSAFLVTLILCALCRRRRKRIRGTGHGSGSSCNDSDIMGRTLDRDGGSCSRRRSIDSLNCTFDIPRPKPPFDIPPPSLPSYLSADSV